MDCFQTSQQYNMPQRTQVFRLARHFVSTFTVSIHGENVKKPVIYCMKRHVHMQQADVITL